MEEITEIRTDEKKLDRLLPKKLTRDKIKNFNLGKVIVRLRDQGLSIPQIKDEIARETGISLHVNSLYNYLKETDVKKTELIKRDIDSQKTIKELAMNYKNEITEILDEVKRMKKKAVEEDDIQAYDKMVGRIFQGLELINKIVDGGGNINNIKNQKVDINVLYQNIFEESNEKYGKLKKDILGFDANIQNLIREEDIKEEFNLRNRVKDKIIDADYINVKEIKKDDLKDEGDENEEES